MDEEAHSGAGHRLRFLRILTAVRSGQFLLSQGRLAEAAGEQEIWRDLRMKLFIDPDDMKAKYEASPQWLKKLMNAWADGLNYFLHTHPQVKPRVITRFEPWMALTFSEGSIGGDVEHISLEALQAFYAGDAPATRQVAANAADLPLPEPTGSNGFAIAPKLATQWRNASSWSIAAITGRLSARSTASG